MLKLKCPHCGSYLGLETMYDGCDWQSAAGAGSGFGYVIALTCSRRGCGRVYPVGRVRREKDFSEPAGELRPYSGRGE